MASTRGWRGLRAQPLAPEDGLQARGLQIGRRACGATPCGLSPATRAGSPFAERRGGRSRRRNDRLRAAIDAGATDCDSSEAGHEITCAPDDLSAVRDALEAKFGAPEQASLGWRPNVTVPVDDERADVLFKLLEQLDESDDVQRVVGNFEVSDAALARLNA